MFFQCTSLLLVPCHTTPMWAATLTCCRLLKTIKVLTPSTYEHDWIWKLSACRHSPQDEVLAVSSEPVGLKFLKLKHPDAWETYWRRRQMRRVRWQKIGICKHCQHPAKMKQWDMEKSLKAIRTNRACDTSDVNFTFQKCERINFDCFKTIRFVSLCSSSPSKQKHKSPCWLPISLSSSTAATLSPKSSSTKGHQVASWEALCRREAS